ncbi:MAG: hypothetical protein CMF69_10760 [Magnetovibrio sp.]|nr:hypothetical protein [Magnetovibrio sp.]|tara:strand:- start:45 stop:548 length:504 start_codon:yes stop_codon:yes gene_type:complete
MINSNNGFKFSVFPVAIVLLIALFVGGCVTDMQNKPKETFGKIFGAGLGALTGSQIGSGKGQMAAVAVGALAGAWMGGEIGKSLDAADKLLMDRTTQQSLEYSRTGTRSSWRNPDSGNAGSVTPAKPFKKASGQVCREFEQTIYVDGKQETATGKACRNNDGTWKII